jgi:transposase
MSTMARMAGPVTLGIDTHADLHVVAVLDRHARVLDTVEIASTPSGHAELRAWIAQWGPVRSVGIEGTGSYGAQLARELRAAGHTLVEVDRPDRSARRRQGKSDPLDAVAAARAAHSGTATATPKTRDGAVEAIRALRVARRSAVRARTVAINQLRALLLAGPPDLRERFRTHGPTALVQAMASLRPGPNLADPREATKYALRDLARRHHHLSVEIAELDKALTDLVATTAPALLARIGLGTDTAGALLVAAGDNPDRLRSESAFAHLCGVAPLPASSGRTQRHRLNRGGDRQANNALWRIVMVRMRYDQRTRNYVDRRTKEGLSKTEIIRCLKRYVAREIYPDLA